MEQTCQLPGCENVFPENSRRLYCSDLCRGAARRQTKRISRLKNETVLGRRLQYLLDHQGAVERPMTCAEWRGEHPTQHAFVKQGEPRKIE